MGIFSVGLLVEVEFEFELGAILLVVKLEETLMDGKSLSPAITTVVEEMSIKVDLKQVDQVVDLENF